MAPNHVFKYLRNVDQEGIYLAVYTIIHLKFCQKDVNTEGYELDT